MKISSRPIRPFTKRDLLSRLKHDELVKWLNAFLSMEIRPASKGKVVIADANVVLDLADNAGDAESPPQNWAIHFKLKENFAKYFRCVIWSDGVEGAEKYVAKPWLLWEDIASRTHLGVEHTYAYDDETYGVWNVKRTDSYSGTSEDQLVHPPYSENDIITASLCGTGLTDPNGAAIVWEMWPDRNWAEIE